MARHSCSAVCTPGLEEVLGAELRALGIKPGPARHGGVAFTATTRQLYLANRWLRTANRVLARAARFRATSWDELHAGVSDIDWAALLPPSRPIHLRVSSSASRLYHTGAIAERLAAAIDHPLAPDAADEAQLVVVRVTHDEVTLSLDSSGEALHRRSWRPAVAKAPLRPTIAAAMLLATGWDGTTPLVDPFCGSGTIAIEAARLALGLPPDGDRDFGFRHWPGFEPGTWASVEGEVARAGRSPDVAIVAADRDAGAAEATRENAARARVDHVVDVHHQSVSDLEPREDGPGWMMTNPPYGQRVGGGDLRNLYARLGDVARVCLPGWGVALLAADDRLARQTGLHLAERLRTTSGGTPVHLLATRLPKLRG